MKLCWLAVTLACAAGSSAMAQSASPTDPACLIGAYRSTDGAAMALLGSTSDAKTVRFVMLDGHSGGFQPTEPGVMSSKVDLGDGVLVAARLDHARCDAPAVRITMGARPPQVWIRRPLTDVRTRFRSGDAELAGQLLLPRASHGRPALVVYTHGSEATAAIDHNAYALLLAARGVAGFVYDKRGTGASTGQYTQDFERLGEDAAQAVRTARALTRGKVSRIGVWGGSQGGWVAPLGASKAGADFVAVDYGVVGTPVEQDIWQVNYELAHLPAVVAAGAEAEVSRVTAVTATIAESDFREHLGDLEALHAAYGTKPWFSKIEGQYTGELLRGEIDRARSESPAVIWRYDSLKVLNRLTVPQLWIMAKEDSVAPSAPSVCRLEQLQDQGKPIDIAVFPDSDHGIRVFHIQPDGTRKYYGYAPGSFELLVDWVKGDLHGSYGKASLRLAADRRGKSEAAGPASSTPSSCF